MFFFFFQLKLLLPEGVLSLADIFENANSASGKFGGVAGVLQGVICKKINIDWNWNLK